MGTKSRSNTKQNSEVNNMDNLLTIIILGPGLFAIFAFLIFYGIMMDKEEKRQKAQNEAPKHSEDTSTEVQTVDLNVKVIDLKFETHYEGIKLPKLIKTFLVFFEDENGKVFNIEVSEENFDAFEIGQKGLLTLEDGQLYSFQLDEE